MMQILSELASAPDEIAGLLSQVPPEKLAWVPPTWEGIPGERFTALGQACHLRDIERDGYHERFGRTLREVVDWSALRRAFAQTSVTEPALVPAESTPAPAAGARASAVPA